MHGKSVRLCIFDVHSSKDLPSVQWLSFTPEFLLMSLSLVYSCLWLIILRHTSYTYPSLNPPLGLPFLIVVSGSHSGMLLGRLFRGIRTIATVCLQ